ncbi:twin-arginine translocase TatA/TatE family subunit [Paenibacillus bouchesdurhonensis]|uniref:twin-arginine translocase TatA/TatE family subunit n=1 Tax=Paenibacillus bouchesdurhonensis TaxID=1870990 RepID=UPI000DA5F7D5|nr:twin-arginine translocase TatA/TatE family subunit [Paenibacillus bouchesdurhonensis]
MSAGGLLLIIIAALIIFGPNKLPELGRVVGRTFKEFKDATQGIMEDQPQANKAETTQPPVTIQESAKVEERRLPE